MSKGDATRMRKRHIAIVGYGTAGQALALLLSRDGHAVEVFERAPQLGPVGAGFLLQPTGLHWGVRQRWARSSFAWIRPL